jgi:hypothetical protein
MLPLGGFDGSIRPEVAGSTSFKETGKPARTDTILLKQARRAEDLLPLWQTFLGGC